MTADRIKEIQAETAYPNSTSVQQALLKVWNECEQGQEQVKNCSIPDVGQSLPDAEQCLKIQEQVKQYCYIDQSDNPVISSGGIRAIISRWKQMIG